MADSNPSSALVGTFSEIYSSHNWGGGSRSGPGSDVSAVSEYSNLLRRLLDELQVKSVTDLGCGDWTFSKTIDWGDRDYHGVDVVPALVSNLTSKYGATNRHFSCRNIIQDDLPTADFCVCKDVLQHLSNASAAAILGKVKKFKYALVTNDVRRYIKGKWKTLWMPTQIGVVNSDTIDGGTRPINILLKPFEFGGTEVLRYNVPVGKAIYTKQVVLRKRDEESHS